MEVNGESQGPIKEKQQRIQSKFITKNMKYKHSFNNFFATQLTITFLYCYCGGKSPPPIGISTHTHIQNVMTNHDISLNFQISGA